jgi:hypothetical protein
MRFRPKDPPRTFRVGRAREVEISHCADVELDPDQQVTFTATSGSEFDVVRKDWGYYATPSLNGRLRDHGLRAVLVRGDRDGRMYLLLVERGREGAFDRYVDRHELRIVSWLDDDDAVERATSRLASG